MKLLLIHFTTTACLGLSLTGLGLCIRYHIGRRRFNRRSIAGLQLFSSYSRGLILTCLESLFNLLGLLAILAGLLLLALNWLIK